MATQLVTTCSAFAGGVAAVTGQGKTVRVTFGGTWATNDTYLLSCVFTQSGISERFGAGDLTNKDMNFLLTYNEKQNVLAEQTWYFSQLNNSTLYNNPDGVGNGNIQLANSEGISEDLVAIAPFQNKMAIFAPNNTFIYITGAEPENYSKSQVLQGVGTLAPLSVKGLGMLEVLFLQGGVRSLLARQNDLAAGITDIGTPIDQLILDAVDGGASQTAACAIVEPNTRRYWLHIGGVIYVLSNYPQSGVVAWSTYLPKASTTVGLKGQIFDESGLITSGVSTNSYYYYLKGNSTGLAVDTGNLSASGYFYTGADTEINIAGTIGQAYTGELYKVDTFVDFTPVKFEVSGNVIYVLGSDNKIYAYGSSTGLLYDCTQATLQVPWLADGAPMTLKQFDAIDVAMKGAWVISAGADPTSGTLSSIWSGGSASSPNTQIDSTYDALKIPFQVQGTHATFKAVSSLSSYKLCRFSGLNILYIQLETT